MQILGVFLLALSGFLFAFQGGPIGDVHDPLWLWLEPKLGLGWGVTAVFVEAAIVYLPGVVGAWLVWKRRLG